MPTSFLSFWGIFLSLSLHYVPSTATSHVHIVYLGLNHAHDPFLTEKSHIQLLSNVFSGKDQAKESMLYSYKHSFSGFAAMLNSTQATTLAEMEVVISVFRSKTLQLHTTRSWEFMGLNLDNEKKNPINFSSYGDDVIVGIFDTGIWPESDSFRQDSHIGPVPRSWNGTCIKGEKFDPAKACNRKLIGARYYINGFEKEFGPLNATENTEYRSPRDRLGHGTHTASTAVGLAVKNASFFGLAPGTARGGAPLARLAVYKICWYKDLEGRCTEADILAAYDDALRDGVHVISASLGASPPLMPFFSSSSDIGSFHAVQKGVTVVFSAGNDGPDSSLVQNVAPWGINVAASTIDRMFLAQIRLGNNISFMGVSFIVQQMKMKLADGTKFFSDGVCDFQKWKGKLASGTIVLCFSVVGQVPSDSAALAVLAANGSGMIFAEPFTRQFLQDDLLPTIHVDIYQGTQILYYIQSAKDPMVQIIPSKTVIGHSPAPSVAYFSSRGPSSVSPNILKPDVTAPGVNILAAWPLKTSPTILPIDRRSVNWNFQSGTSMSCPHVSGVVALLKSAHPDWSPAAIKSALMTTAYNIDTSHDSVLAGGTTKPVDPFDIGAGHINPIKAMDPGLVYDMDTRDYILFLCSISYTQDQIRNMVLPSPCIDTSCPEGDNIDMNLNYPAIIVSNLQSSVTIKRTLRNVDRSRAIYYASVVNPAGVQVVVWPMYLIFSWHKVKITYYVTLTPLKRSKGRYDFGEIVWSDGYHHVRSPLVVLVNNDWEGGNDLNIYSVPQ